MLVYNYDPFTGELLNASEADLSPLDAEQGRDDVYLIPANATQIVPPTAEANYTAVFDSNSQTWSSVIDNRSVVAYKVDEKGFILGQYQFKLGEELTASGVVTTAIPTGLVLPKWVDGTWIEGYVPPVPVVDNTLQEQVTSLASENEKLTQMIAEMNAKLEKLLKGSSS